MSQNTITAEISSHGSKTSPSVSPVISLWTVGRLMLLRWWITNVCLISGLPALRHTMLWSLATRVCWPVSTTSKQRVKNTKAMRGANHPVLPVVFSSSSSKSILLGCHKGMAMICVYIGRWVAELTRSHPLPWWQKCGSISNNRRSIPESILRYHCSVLSLSDSFFSFSHSLIVKHTCQYANDISRNSANYESMELIFTLSLISTTF